MIVWNVARASAGETLEGHAGQVSGLAFSADGATLYSGGLDSKIVIWDLAGGRRLGRPFAIPDKADPRFALRHDGRELAIGHDDGTVALIDARTLRERSRFRATPAGPVRAWATSPLAAARRRRRKRLPGADGSARRPDAQAAAGSSRPGLHPQLQRRRPADGRAERSRHRGRLRAAVGPAGQPGDPLRADIADISLSPDGRTVALTRPRRRVEILDVPSAPAPRHAARLRGCGTSCASRPTGAS